MHVGVQGGDRAIQACDRLRPVLPILLAISANSPFIDGRDSGPAFRPHADLHEVLPALRRPGRRSAPGATWQDYVELLVRTNSIVEYTQLWWSVRPHHAYGTIEVRICDAQTTATEADALIELIVACVAQALREIDAGETPPDIPGRLIEENMWRALRYGQDGRLLDLGAPSDRGVPRGGGRWTG